MLVMYHKVVPQIMYFRQIKNITKKFKVLRKSRKRNKAKAKQ